MCRTDTTLDGDVTSFSRAASLMEIAGGIALGLAGLYALRQRAQPTGRSALSETAVAAT